MKSATRERLARARRDALAVPGTDVFTAVLAAAGGDVGIAMSFLTGRGEPSNQHKRARAAAYAEASKRGLWATLAGSLAWWRKLLARIFPRLAKRYNAWVGRAYKRQLKDWARQAYAWLRNGGPQESAYLERKRARINRKFLAKLRKPAVPLSDEAKA
jgi:hypothetical protein